MAIEFISEETVINPEVGNACLKVVGVGGAGGNAVNSMLADRDWTGVKFIVANTDAQALNNSPAETKIQLGNKITKGLGAGSNPEVGRRSAEEDLDGIKKSIEGADIVFLTAGLGGGTGSGALPVIANAAKELGILTVAVVTKPFMFEGKRRLGQATKAIEVLESAADTIIVVPNQKLLEIADPKISMLDAFGMSNTVLNQAVKGIADIIQKPGLINVDFADVRTIMQEMGKAIMGTGRASGEDRAKNAALQAISSPLLENMSVEGARGILLNITGNANMGLHEINEAAQVVYDLVSEDANIILGSVIDPSMDEDLVVTIIATGLKAVETTKQTEKRNPFDTPAAWRRPNTLRPAQCPTELKNISIKDKPQLGELAKLVEGVTNEQHHEEGFEEIDTPTYIRKTKKTDSEQIDK